MRLLVLATLCAAALLIPTGAAAQAIAPATLRGTVSDEAGAALPRARVIVSAETGVGGARTTVTNEDGAFAFHSLPGGAYLIKIELAGCRTLSDRVTLRSGDMVAFDATLERGRPTEPMATPRRTIPRSLSPVLTTTLDEGLLTFLPFESRSATDALQLAPGVHPANHSASGGAGRSANRYTLDAGSLADPRGEGVWMDGSYQWLRAADVLSHGAGAEHGGYGGVLVTGVLPSGGEHLAGAIEALFTNDALSASNVSQTLLDENPSLAEPSHEFLFDSSAHLGGPLRSGQSWFFTGAQFSRHEVTPAGYEGSPSVTAIRAIFKPTFAWGAGQHLSSSVVIERVHDDALFAGPRVTPDATLNDSRLSLLFSGTYSRALSSASTLDARYSGLWGRTEQSPPHGDTPGVYDLAQDLYTANAVDFYDARRTAHEFGATWSHLFSSHTLKAGAEFEVTGARTETGYNGGLTIDALFGVPSFAYTWEGDRRDSTNRRLSAFLQDAWLAGARLAITGGVRLDRISGSLARLDGSVFETTSLAPRIGLAWAPATPGTVVRASYGWYFQGAKSSYFDRLDPGITPIMGVVVDANLHPIGTPTIVSPGTRHDIDTGLEHPRTQQAAASVERSIAWQILLRVAGIYRRSDRFVDDVLQFGNTEFATRAIADAGPDGFPGSGDESGNTVTGYDQRTDPFQSRLLITNPDGAFQTHRALEVSAIKRFQDAWQVHASWVYSRTTGNYDNLDALGNLGDYDTPNVDPRFQPLREGRLSNDPTHLLKAFGTYTAPWQIIAGVAFYYTSGQALTRTVRVRFNQGREELFVEPRGSRRLGAENRLDIRLERPFSIGRGRLSVVAEGFNLMNRGTVTSRVAASGAAWLTPEGVMPPRRFRLGAVYRF